MDDLHQQFNRLMNSKDGEAIVEQLNLRAEQLVADAMTAETQDTAFGLLKEASGVIKAIAHLQFLSVVSSDEEGEVKN